MKVSNPVLRIVLAGVLGVSVGAASAVVWAEETTPAQTTVNDAADVAYWPSINQHKPAELKAYLAAFPSGRFASLAKVRLDELGQAPAQAAQPPATAPAKPAAEAAPPPAAEPTKPAEAQTAGPLPDMWAALSAPVHDQPDRKAKVVFEINAGDPVP